MRTQSGTQENPATALTPAIEPRMPWRVTAVQAMPGFRLRLRFVDGTQGIVDLSQQVHAPHAGVFAALTDPALYDQVFIAHGAVTWPGEIDLAPDAIYAQIQAGQRSGS